VIQSKQEAYTNSLYRKTGLRSRERARCVPDRLVNVGHSARALPWGMPFWARTPREPAVVDPIQPLRMAAIYERLGQHVGSDQLIKMALDAVLAGVDSPALVLLAGLGRKEEPEAHELFALACDELGLAPALPADPAAARWKLIRWLSGLIMAGELAPKTAPG
jgi:hypothetical protein